MTEHEHVAELLTWFVNGRLDAREQTRVTEHLERCAMCRAELALQQRLRAAITQPVKVEFAPQTSFNKLWDRVTAEQANPSLLKRRRNSAAISQPGRWLQRLADHWVPVTLSMQLLVIIALLGVLFMRGNLININTAAYRTVSSSDAINDNRPIIHVVFDEATRLTDVKDILSKSGLEVASGPTAAGVYSLTPDSAHATSLQQTVTSLRGDPRVRFAELSHP